MTDHLPECPVVIYETVGHRYVVAPDMCICWRLRAHGERIIATGAGAVADIEFGRQKGLREARDAVDAACGWRPAGRCPECTQALAAIDALIEAAS